MACQNVEAEADEYKKGMQRSERETGFLCRHLGVDACKPDVVAFLVSLAIILDQSAAESGQNLTAQTIRCEAAAVFSRVNSVLLLQSVVYPTVALYAPSK